VKTKTSLVCCFTTFRTIAAMSKLTYMATFHQDKFVLIMYRLT